MDGEDEKLFKIMQKSCDSYLDDDGFTAQVMDRLPQRKERHNTRRTLMLALSALAGSLAFTLKIAPELQLTSAWVAKIHAQFTAIGTNSTLTLVVLGASLLFCGLVVSILAPRHEKGSL